MTQAGMIITLLMAALDVKQDWSDMEIANCYRSKHGRKRNNIPISRCALSPKLPDCCSKGTHCVVRCPALPCPALRLSALSTAPLVHVRYCLLRHQMMVKQQIHWQ